jgi:p-hydroxybenzoate 3-monooxygenase
MNSYEKKVGGVRDEQKLSSSPGKNGTRAASQMTARTQVGIVGAGPAGLVLAQLLHLAGIDSVVLECRSRAYCEERVRAGVLDQNTVDLLVEMGVGERLKREGLVHSGVNLRFGGRTHRIGFGELTSGRAITIYSQHEVTKDLISARLASGRPLHFEVEQVSISDLDGGRPKIRYVEQGESRELACDFVAGCDGFHGVCRAAIPAAKLNVFQRDYPFAWLGILAKAPPSSPELIYAYHQRGFALLSMRTPEITRLYVQCRADDDMNDWPDERVWEELHARLACEEDWKLTEGPVLQKGIAKIHSVVVEPMQHGALFLAGDAAHIVPPTGAKGLNLAVADVSVMARAFQEFYASGRRDLFDGYSEKCLRRIWNVQRFSWWMTMMLHRLETDSAFDQRRQLAELDYITGSRAASQTFAENYVGLPME